MERATRQSDGELPEDDSEEDTCMVDDFGDDTGSPSVTFSPLAAGFLAASGETYSTPAAEVGVAPPPLHSRSPSEQQSRRMESFSLQQGRRKEVLSPLHRGIARGCFVY